MSTPTTVKFQIQVTPVFASESDASEPTAVPTGDAPLPKDPPVH